MFAGSDLDDLPNIVDKQFPIAHIARVSSIHDHLNDLLDQMGGLTVVVMTEFGRRARENGSLGTDHGHGGLMMIMGGTVNGGKVYGDWPGLDQQQLVGPGDLAVTTDYRDVLASAEYPNYMKEVPAGGGFAEDDRQRVISLDWKQYQEWLTR